MIDNNKNIAEYLCEYAENLNPQYAIMLTGEWGCGKSYFIQNWISKYKEKQKEEKDKLVLKPIYVSLYGLTNVQQITDNINREISPWLYSDGMQYAKKIMIIASKAVLKYDFDANGDKKNDGSITYSLDGLSLLKNENSDIKGNKILIFDDFERSQIGLQTLLGYINAFVEHYKCKVIIIGDTNKIKDEKIEREGKPVSIFSEFKEKTIGRTFQINSDIENAISTFIKELVSNTLNQLDENRELIIGIFLASKYNNLRVLRQCLNDYARVVDKFPRMYHHSPKYKLFIQNLISHFIIIYCEYKIGCIDFKKCFSNFALYSDLLTKEERREREIISKKYFHIFTNNGLSFIDESYVNIITHYLNNGAIDSNLFASYLNDEPEQVKEDWEFLLDIYSLNNNTFKEHYNNMVAKFKKNEYDTMSNIIGTTGVLLNLVDSGLSTLKNKTVMSICNTNIERLIKQSNDVDSLYKLQASFSVGARRIQENIDFKPIWISMNHKILRKVEKIDNTMTLFIENINDDNINLLHSKLLETYIDKQRPNTLAPIFKNVNANKLVKSIIKLSNTSKCIFCDELSMRYELSDKGVNQSIVSCLKEDFITLEKVSNLLNKKIKKMTLLEKYVTNEVIVIIDKIVDILK